MLTSRAVKKRPLLNDPSLTPRERQVIKYVSFGLTNRQIAFTLDISDQTVKNHIHSAYGKLAVNSRLQLMAKVYLGDSDYDHLKTVLSKYQRGFTLLEVLIALLLTGIMAAGITPLLTSMIIFPNLSTANMEVANLRTAETKWLISNNSTPTIEDLRVYVPTISGNYTITSDNVIVGLSYPGLKWNDSTNKWSIKR